METVLGWLTKVPGGLVFLLCEALAIAGMAFLVDWWRGRGQETVEQQIALTDAIYGRFGSIASPVVKDPLWGRRQILFAVRPDAVSKALVAAHEVLSVADRMKLGRYEIVLTPEQTPASAAQRSRENESQDPWSGDMRAAA